jgi:Mn-containing catalase
VQALAGAAGEVHVLMNNCYEDYGVRNAADMTDLLAAVAG